MLHTVLEYLQPNPSHAFLLPPPLPWALVDPLSFVRTSFTGSFRCPNTTEFCALETITGVLHPEFVRWQLFLVMAVVVGLPLLLAVLCALPCRDTFAIPFKRWWVQCGSECCCLRACLLVPWHRALT